MMDYLRCMSRDHARTPVQWNDGPEAGFTSGTAWMAVNPNYKEINAKNQLSDGESVFYYYKKLIELRKHYDIIVYGSFELILAEDTRVFAYIRRLEDEKLLVLCNFTEKELQISIPEEFQSEDAVYLIQNYDDSPEKKDKLLPYEAAVIYVKEKINV